jgi:hypothetical protein
LVCFLDRAGLLRDPEQGSLAHYFKTKKPSSELVVFSYLKHCGFDIKRRTACGSQVNLSMIIKQDYFVILQSYALKIHQTKKRSSKLGVFSY